MTRGTEQRQLVAIMFMDSPDCRELAAEDVRTASGIEASQSLYALYVNTQGARVP